MSEEEKEALRKLLYNNKWTTDPQDKDPLVTIWFVDLVDLLEDYKTGRL